MEVEDVGLQEPAERTELSRSKLRMRKALNLLTNPSLGAWEGGQDGLNTADVAQAFSNGFASPLDVYRAAGCLRENELREIVQYLTFAGGSAVFSALRLLNIMRGLPGNWELTMDLLEEQGSEELSKLPQRVMTLIAFLGGRKTYRLCSWSNVVEKATQNDEEAKIAMCMVLGKRWEGNYETVYSLLGWHTELDYANNPSIWREMRWAAYTRELIMRDACGEASAALASAQDAALATLSTSAAIPSYPAFESLPAEPHLASENYVRVCGQLMRRRRGKSPTASKRPTENIQARLSGDLLPAEEIVITPSIRLVLRQLACSVCYGKPVVLEGSSGCGKTSVISLLAKKTWRERLHHEKEVPGVTFVQMDSAMTDSDGDTLSSLLGGIVPLPEGSGFRWRPGPIGVAAEQGDWVVFENIGKSRSATSSAIPLIAKLASLEPGDELEAPGRAYPLRIRRGFRCIITRTVQDSSRTDEWEPPGGWRVWQRIRMASLTLEDKTNLLRQRYPSISDCVLRIVKATQEVSKFVETLHGPLMRTPTLREAVRICARLADLRLKDPARLTVENALLETIDVLSAWCPHEDQNAVLLQLLSSCWSSPPDIASELSQHHRPSFSAEGSTLHIGRAAAHIAEQAAPPEKSNISLTGHTLRLLERGLRCLELNEHVLLTGEAGCGKTSVIQELARLLGKKLVVVNLSRQSEMGDLVGGFRPLELAAAVPMLARRFEKAFCITLSKVKNGRFLDALQSASRSPETHLRAVRLMGGAMSAIPREKSSHDIQLRKEWNAIADELSKLSLLFSPSVSVCKAGGVPVSEDCAQLGKIDEPARKRPKVKEPSQKLGDSFPAEEQKGAKSARRKVDFRFSEGVLAQAMREGNWILLDEINLAPAELLERLVSVADRGQLVLPNENGDVVSQADGFRLFGAMNPPTDVGKRPLPEVLRSRFSEIYVGDVLEHDDIASLVLDNLFGASAHTDVVSLEMANEQELAHDVASFYIQCHQLSKDASIEDIAGKRVRFSLRSLSRMLGIAACLRNFLSRGLKGVRRALYEGAVVAFATPLPTTSRAVIMETARRTILKLKNHSAHLHDLSELVAIPSTFTDKVRSVEGFPVVIRPKNPALLDDAGNESPFVISENVKRTLQDVCRAMIFGCPRLPILLQGPTAAGKTSLVKYLAAVTGNSMVRINNHEHTDLSEYLGGYVVTEDGSLMFNEGPLVRAARDGSWVLLDELNLAPPEVLEALNRLLDDNRELFIAETGEVVKAADGFAVFATQNPPGLYGGRKELSRAFRSRFVEIQVMDLTDQDLSMILERRCHIPKSFATKMIGVMRELQVRRRSTSLFAGRQGFITARDLFRWAAREPRSKEELAIHGYLLLGERSRLEIEKEVVRSIIVQTTGIDASILDHDRLYRLSSRIQASSPAKSCLDFSMSKLGMNENSLLSALDEEGLALTPHTERLIILLIHAMANAEPVLLVGTTGSGKTSCCAAICRAMAKPMISVNCHRNTEASDFVGSFRPVRSRQTDAPLFEWVDGPLVSSMKQGSVLLIDEANMADDAVIERLNSVLELERILLLSERGVVSTSKGSDLRSPPSLELVVANSMFRLLATMNPGGDFGKKELSPALRNRFTEVWVPPPSFIDDFIPIVRQSLCPNLSSGVAVALQEIGDRMIEFLQWTLASTSGDQDEKEFERASLLISRGKPHLVLSIRDVIAWCTFIKSAVSSCCLNPILAFIHGARLVFLEGMSVGATSRLDQAIETRIWERLLQVVPEELLCSARAAKFNGSSSVSSAMCSLQRSVGGSSTGLKFGAFTIPTSREAPSYRKFQEGSSFSFESLSTTRNCMRLARAMTMGSRPLLLEGPPGCGKSSLITALSQLCGFRFIRINLSEFTEMSDLVGSESPGQEAGTFAFREGPLLVALRRGSWVLLDELNLASQSVLEGLNSVLDHRRSLFVSEIGQEVKAESNFRVFGAQNPASEGGGRRGLPRSFLNRFTRVQIEAPGENDILSILAALYPRLDSQIIRNITSVLEGIENDLHLAGRSFECSSFGLRDALRWCDLLSGIGDGRDAVDKNGVDLELEVECRVGLFFDVSILQGLKPGKERTVAVETFRRVFGFDWDRGNGSLSIAGSEYGDIRVGHARIERSGQSCEFVDLDPNSVVLARTSLRELQALIFAVKAGWPVVLRSEFDEVSEHDCITHVETLAALCGRTIRYVDAASLTDSDDFVGNYQQQDILHIMEQILHAAEAVARRCVFLTITSKSGGTVGSLHLSQVRSLEADLSTMLEATVENRSLVDNTVGRFLKVSHSLGAALSSFLLDSDVCNHKRNLAELSWKLQRLFSATRHGKFASFEWCKSSFVRSIEDGEWIILRNAGSCSPALLDRLNPILERQPTAVKEQNGVANRPETPAVVLAEAPPNDDGSPVLLKPHSEFRIFFILGSSTMRRARSILSKALQDRSLKISLHPSGCLDEGKRDWQGQQVDSSTLSGGDRSRSEHSAKLLKTDADISCGLRHQMELQSLRLSLATENILNSHSPLFVSGCIRSGVVGYVRTHVVDFVLDPMGQLVDRDIRIVERLSCFILDHMQRCVEVDAPLINSERLTPSFGEHSGVSAIKWVMWYKLAEAFVMGSRSVEDIQRRLAVLSSRAIAAQDSVVEAVYNNMASHVQPWRAQRNFSDYRCDFLEEAMAPLDPLYGGGEDFLSVLSYTESTKTGLDAFTTAKRFRLQVLAIGPFVSSWTVATEGCHRSTLGKVSLFEKGRMQFNIESGFASRPATTGLEVLSYSVLHRMWSALDKMESHFTCPNGWEDPGESDLISFLQAGSELCRELTKSTASVGAKEQALLLEALAFARNLLTCTDATFFDFSDLEAAVRRSSASNWTEMMSENRIHMLPRTKGGQELEAEMVALASRCDYSKLSNRDRDGIVKGIASLSSQEVEGNQDVLSIIRDVTKCLAKGKTLCVVSANLLPRWVEGEGIKALNLVEGVLALAVKENIAGLPLGSSGQLRTKDLSASVVTFTCLDGFALGLKVSLQRMQWAVDSFSRGEGMNLREVSFRDLKVTAVSNYLCERATMLFDRSNAALTSRSDPQRRFADAGRSGDFEGSLFWNLVSAKRQFLSTLSSLALGSYVLGRNSCDSDQILLNSLLWAVQLAGLCSIDTANFSNSHEIVKCLDALLASTAGERGMRSEDRSDGDLRSLQVDAIRFVLKNFKTRSALRCSQNTLAFDVLNEVSVLGQAWIAVALLQLRSCHGAVQRAGICDPSELAGAVAIRNFQKATQAGAGVLAYRALAINRLSGECSRRSVAIQRLEAEKTAAAEASQKAAQHCVFRPQDRQTYGSYVAFADSVDSVVTAKAIRAASLSCLGSLDATIVDRPQEVEEVVDLYCSCDSTASSLEITGNLSHFRDLSADLLLGLRELQYGIACLLRAESISTLLCNVASSSRVNLYQDVICFPRAAFPRAFDISRVLIESRASGVGHEALMACAEYLINADMLELLSGRESASKALTTLSKYWKQSRLIKEEKLQRDSSLHILREAGRTEESLSHGIVDQLDADEERDFRNTFNPIDEGTEGTILGWNDRMDYATSKAAAAGVDVKNKSQTELNTEQFWGIHMRAFSLAAAESVQAAQQHHASAVQTFARHLPSFAEGLRPVADVLASPWEFFATLTAVQKFESTRSVVDVGTKSAVGPDYNFYTDAHTAELLRASDVLQELLERIALIQSTSFRDTDEHPVLAEVAASAMRLANACTLSSPLSHVMIGIENILRKANEWQRLFARPATKLDKEVLELSRVMAGWRKLELSSWKHLLKRRAHSFSSRASKWFLFLYDAIINESTTESLMNTDAFRNVVSAVDRFLRSSPSGEFQTRVDMVLSIGSHVLHISKTRLEVLTPLGWALRGIAQYYSLFLPRVSEESSSASNVVASKLDDFCRLHTWDSKTAFTSSGRAPKEHEKHLEYYRMKAFAERTKRKIHKLCQEVDSNLRVPVYEHMMKQIANIGFSTLETEASSDDGDRKFSVEKKSTAAKIQFSVNGLVSNLSSEIGNAENIEFDNGGSKESTLPNLDALRRKLLQFGTLVNASADQSGCATAVDFLVRLRTIIRNRSLSLRKAEAAGVQPKKRALVELFKLLHKAGLSPFEQAISTGLADSFGWLSAPEPTFSDDYNSVATGLYHNGAQQLRRLREVSDERCRSSDITAGEAVKLRALCSDLFDRASAERFSMELLFGDFKSTIGTLEVMAGLGTDDEECEKRPTWSSQTLMEVVDTCQRLDKICLDMETTESAVQFALRASDVQQRAKPGNPADSLIKMQAPETRVSLTDVGTLLRDGSTAIRSALSTAEVHKLYDITSQKIIVMSNSEISALDQGVQHLVELHSTLCSLLAKAEAVSHSNVAVKILASTVSFLAERRVEWHDAASPNSDGSVRNIDEVCSSMIVGLESLRDHVLVGAQNVLAWNKLSVDDVVGNKLRTPDPSTKIEGSGRGQLNIAHSEIVGFRASSNISEMRSALDQNLNLITCLTDRGSPAEVNSDQFKVVCRRQRQMAYFCQAYLRELILPCVRVICSLHCHSLALLRTLSSLFAGLCAEGFCRPTESLDADHEDDGSNYNEQGGTGFGNVGDGDLTGAQDVSEQVEDEEQLLGLQNEKPDHNAAPEVPGEEQEKGFDMTSDFDGALQEVEQSRESQEEDGEAKDMSKQMSAESGRGANAIDERLWGDDDTPNNDENLKNTSDPSTVPAGEKSSDFVGHDEDENPRPSQENDGHKDNLDLEAANDSDSVRSDDADEQILEFNADKTEGENTTEPDQCAEKQPQAPQGTPREDARDVEENERQRSGDAVDNTEKEDRQCRESSDTDALDCDNNGEPTKNNSTEFPRGDAETDENIMDGESADGAADENDDTLMTGVSDDALEGREAADDQEFAAEDGWSGEKVEEDLPFAEEGEQDNDHGLGEDQSYSDSGDGKKDEWPGNAGGDATEDLPEYLDNKMDEELPASDDGIGRGQNFETGEGEPSRPEALPGGEELDGTATTNQAGSHGEKDVGFLNSSGSQAGVASSEDIPAEGPGTGTNKGNHNDGEGIGEEVFGGDDKDGYFNDRKTKFSFEPNPHRDSSGKALASDWARYLKEVSGGAEDEEAGGSRKNVESSAAWKFENGGSNGSTENLALGPATADQHQPLPHEESGEDAIRDHEGGESGESKREPSNSDGSRQRFNQGLPPHRNPPNQLDPELKETSSKPRGAGDQNLPDVASEDLEAGKVGNGLAESVDPELCPIEGNDINAMDIDETPEGPLDVGPSDGGTASLRQNAEKLTVERAIALWQRLQAASASGASSLCEQLRLVLEPTVATGLAGGYRTGKRLNIRKVIEFVASDFRKDRIWLRRVKPDKRLYDVLLAIDDSESMAESDAGTLALTSLSLITSALATLEVGRLGVASFGSEPYMVRDFDEPLPLSDQRGGEILQKFRFAQRETNVSKLLEFVNKTMGEMHSDRSEAHMKLAFVISDGRLSSREDIKKHLRQLRDVNILVAFIIVDQISGEKASIYDIRRVEYDERGKVTVMPYMEDFPVEFHAVLRDVTQLPVILADALRQWIEITNKEL